MVVSVVVTMVTLCVRDFESSTSENTSSLDWIHEHLNPRGQSRILTKGWLDSPGICVVYSLTQSSSQILSDCLVCLGGGSGQSCGGWGHSGLLPSFCGKNLDQGQRKR